MYTQKNPGNSRHIDRNVSQDRNVSSKKHSTTIPLSNQCNRTTFVGY